MPSLGGSGRYGGDDVSGSASQGSSGRTTDSGTSSSAFNLSDYLSDISKEAQASYAHTGKTYPTDREAQQVKTTPKVKAPAEIDFNIGEAKSDLSSYLASVDNFYGDPNYNPEGLTPNLMRDAQSVAFKLGLTDTPPAPETYGDMGLKDLEIYKHIENILATETPEAKETRMQKHEERRAEDPNALHLATDDASATMQTIMAAPITGLNAVASLLGGFETAKVRGGVRDPGNEPTLAAIVNARYRGDDPVIQEMVDQGLLGVPRSPAIGDRPQDKAGDGDAARVQALPTPQRQATTQAAAATDKAAPDAEAALSKLLAMRMLSMPQFELLPQEFGAQTLAELLATVPDENEET